jgi:hypothetical protein
VLLLLLLLLVVLVLLRVDAHRRKTIRPDYTSPR